MLQPLPQCLCHPHLICQNWFLLLNSLLAVQLILDLSKAVLHYLSLRVAQLYTMVCQRFRSVYETQFFLSPIASRIVPFTQISQISLTLINPNRNVFANYQHHIIHSSIWLRGNPTFRNRIQYLLLKKKLCFVAGLPNQQKQGCFIDARLWTRNCTYVI